MQTFLYARVSSTDQTISLQRAEAGAAGFKFDEVIEDAGVSGVSTKFSDRRGGGKLLDKLRCGDLLVVRWVYRLGRNYEDVTETIRTLMQRGGGVKAIVNAVTFDGATKDPIQMAVRDAPIAFMAAAAQVQAEATKEAQQAGIKAAREAEDASIRYRGRKPTFDVEQLHRTSELLGMGWTPSAISTEVGIPRTTVYRIKENPAKTVALLHTWAIS